MAAWLIAPRQTRRRKGYVATSAPSIQVSSAAGKRRDGSEKKSNGSVETRSNRRCDRAAHCRPPEAVRRGVVSQAAEDRYTQHGTIEGAFDGANGGAMMVGERSEACQSPGASPSITSSTPTTER